MKLILASSNVHKAQEYNTLLDPKVVSVLSANKKLDVVEDGETFHENALLKAKAYFDEFKQPVIADDSGLVVNALPDELGIFSARFGGEDLSQNDKNDLLIEKISEKEDRSAYFICVICLYLNDSEIFYFEGRLKGQISMKATGDQGFGYDPIFHPEGGAEGKSVAELPEWKQLHSHRAKASQGAITFLKNYLEKR